MIIRTVFDTVLDLLFPPKCVFCGEIVPVGLNASVMCAKCGASAMKPRAVNRQGAAFSVCFAATDYETAKEAIRALKYDGRERLAALFAELFYKNCDFDEIKECQCIVPVPLNAGRLKKRGFNQAALFAARLAELYEIPVIDALERTRDTKAQFGLNAKERAINVKGAFCAAKGAENVRNRKALLVDDILTTGATLSECAEILRSLGAEDVFCAVFAETETRF